jgi:hypothetical protein
MGLAAERGDVQARVGARVGGQHPPPSALDTMAIRLPVGTGWLASSAAASSSSPISRVAMTPARANSASRVTSGVAAARPAVRGLLW